MNDSEKYEYVNHPSHYNHWSEETIDQMIKLFGLQNTINFCEMTAFKYAMRMGFKPDNTVLQDLEKRNWYLDKMNELKNRLTNPSPEPPIKNPYDVQSNNYNKYINKTNTK